MSPSDPPPIVHPNRHYRQMWWRAGWRHGAKGEPLPRLPEGFNAEYAQAYRDGYEAGRKPAT